MFFERVVIIEDERITARYIRGVLTRMGCGVLECYDRAAPLLDSLETLQPDCVMMDININGPLSGIDAAQRMRRSGMEIPVIYITAYSDRETVDEALESAPYGFVTKPFTDKDLEITVRLAYKRYCNTQGAEESTPPQQVQLGETLAYDLEREVLLEGGSPVRLNAKQERLLRLLVQHRNQTVSHVQITYEVWPDEVISASTLRTAVYALRKRVPQLDIRSQSKEGYLLVSLP